MKLVFIGPQGCGKGTQAKNIAEELNLAHISTGDLLRDVSGDLKVKVEEAMNSGALVSDDLILEILNAKLQELDDKNGFILDGFPRNLSQAKALEKLIEIDKFVEINISDDEAVKRISGRRNCPECQKIYNVFTSPIPIDGQNCDDCGIALKQRSDDTESAVKKRLEIYHRETEPILREYSSIKIDGAQEIEKVTQDILERL